MKQIHISRKYEANKVWKTIIIIISYIPKKNWLKVIQQYVNHEKNKKIKKFKRIIFSQNKIIGLLNVEVDPSLPYRGLVVGSFSEVGLGDL